MLGLRNDEPVYTTVELRRGKRRLASKGPTHMRAGERGVKLGIDERVAAGDAILDIGFRDAKGYERAVTRAIKIPSRRASTATATERRNLTDGQRRWFE